MESPISSTNTRNTDDQIQSEYEIAIVPAPPQPMSCHMVQDGEGAVSQRVHGALILSCISKTKLSLTSAQRTVPSARSVAMRRQLLIGERGAGAS